MKKIITISLKLHVAFLQKIVLPPREYVNNEGNVRMNKKEYLSRNKTAVKYSSYKLFVK
jgi:hypothetical protein